MGSITQYSCTQCCSGLTDNIENTFPAGNGQNGLCQEKGRLEDQEIIL